MALLAGRDYPKSCADLRAWFDEDWKCLDYLDWLRWPEGFVCPWCESIEGWRASDRRWRCAGCDRRVSATAGTILHGTRTPLTVWFSAAWHLTSGKGGISATELQREMQFGSYQTAWAMLHRFRSGIVRPGRDRLAGDVEVALTYNELRKAGRTRPPPPPPVRERMLPRSLERQQTGLPWREQETWQPQTSR